MKTLPVRSAAGALFDPLRRSQKNKADCASSSSLGENPPLDGLPYRHVCFTLRMHCVQTNSAANLEKPAISSYFFKTLWPFAAGLFLAKPASGFLGDDYAQEMDSSEDR
jgi:hypothetical protein